jgi:hypothetical protein
VSVWFDGDDDWVPWGRQRFIQARRRMQRAARMTRLNFLTFAEYARRDPRSPFHETAKEYYRRKRWV